MFPKLSATLPGQLIISFIAAVISVIALFFLSANTSEEVWKIVAWPAQFAKTYEHGAILFSVCETIFRSHRQGMLHLTSFFLIVLAWWPVFFLGARYGSKLVR